MKLPIATLLILTSLRLSAALTDTEIADLKFMREEEKLARDVYNVLYAEHGDAQFANIAKSEQRHTDSVLRLLDYNGIADPASAVAGVFTNPDLQALYDQLVAKGLESRLAAFQVGVLIEETDIADLDDAIANTENPELVQLYTNLRNGSLNHLEAFSRGLAASAGFTGATYRNGWFDTRVGWLNLDAHPWVKTDKGRWFYHVSGGNGGHFLATPKGEWHWTSESVYPWSYDLNRHRWSYGLPNP